jgi:hypothetical protein
MRPHSEVKVQENKTHQKRRQISHDFRPRKMNGRGARVFVAALPGFFNVAFYALLYYNTR